MHLADVRIPLALRVADVPVGRDEYNPIKYQYVAKESPESTQTSGETTMSAQVVQQEKPAATVMKSPLPYWNVCIEWAKQIREGTSPLDIPPDCMKVLEERYAGDLFKREFNVLTMISWVYEVIRNSTEITDEKRGFYRIILADSFLEIIWDESIQPVEQIQIIQDPANSTDELKKVTIEQTLKQLSKGVEMNIFRYVNPATGKVEYMCDKKMCNESIVQFLEGNAADPINSLEANNETTGKIYGLIIPKISEAKFVLKTNDSPVSKGTRPEKGKECENVSNISGHKEQLMKIQEMITPLGYPRIIEPIINERETRVKADAAKIAKKKKDAEDAQPLEREAKKVREKLMKDSRKFQNVIKACALKNIVLRMVDKMERLERRKRYFYRPVAAIKSKHRLK